MENYKIDDLRLKKGLQQCIHTIKLLSVVLMVFILDAGATVYSETTRLNAQMTDVTVKEVFKQIEGQSEFRFFYNNNLDDINKRVNIDATNKTVAMILDEILKDSGLTYKILENNLVIVSENRVRQGTTITGVVRDGNGGPMPGVNIVVKGTFTGVVTGIDGDYSIQVPNAETVLVFSFIGYSKQEIIVGAQTQINITLEEDITQLEEVVVTALGLKRAEKALGYAVTELKGDELRTNNINPVTSLQGKVAGVDIAQTDGGMFGSTKIMIRGASTLGKNNQPIYVVDGIIMDNAIKDSDADWSSNSNDWGNELKNLNPDDFETVSVLKGAAATALYGSRGLNGAVVITTKSGRKGQGLGINVSQTFGIDHVYKQPDLQNVFGEGTLSGYVAYGDKDADGNFYAYDNQRQFAYNTAGQPTLNMNEGLSYGPRFDGRSIENYDYSMTTYNPVKNNYRDAFNLGFNSNTNIAVEGGNERTTFYTSLSYKYAKGTLPHNTFERLALLAKASHDITSKVTLTASVAFANSLPKNPPQNVGELFFDGTYQRAYNTNYFRDKYKGEHGGMANTAYGDAYGNIPGKELWWSIYENTYQQKETSVRPTLTLDIDILEWLSFRAEGNYNYYYRRNESKELGTGYANDGGYYLMSLYSKEQTNFNANFLVNQQVGDWSFNGFLRGEYYNNFVQTMSENTEGGLVVPGQYFIGNSKNQATYSGTIEDTKRILSIAFQAGVGWKNQIFVDVTGRNDWSSSLVYSNGTGNYSYYYPSINGSWLLSETFSMPSWVSLLKVRGSWAQVGNDTNPYDINTAYSLSTTQYADYYIYGLGLSNTVYSQDLKPERKNSWEIGIDWRFLDGRIHLDGTFYKENTKNQIMTIDVPGVSGISKQVVNAGNIQNKGIEIALNTVPFRNKDWEWTLDFTYTRNDNKIIELHPNVADYIVLDGDPAYGNFRIGSVAKVGSTYGVLMSDSKPKIDEATGKKILQWSDTQRYAQMVRSGTVEEIASMIPNFLGSLATGLTWKDISFRAAFDMRFGGYVASYGSRYGTAYGLTEGSLKYRAPEYGGVTWTSKFDGLTYSDGIIPDGVLEANTNISQPGGGVYTVADGGETYQALYEKGVIEPTHASSWNYRSGSWANGVITEDWFKKLNYISLREISVFYRMPNSIASKIGAQSLTLGLTGRNLGYLYNTMPANENPESIRGTQVGAFRTRSFAVYTASYMFNINVGF